MKLVACKGMNLDKNIMDTFKKYDTILVLEASKQEEVRDIRSPIQIYQNLKTSKNG